MRVYLDTQVALWLGMGKRERISREGQRIIRQSELLISPAVLFELGILHQIGRVNRPAREVVAKLRGEAGISVCELSFPVVADMALDEVWTRDPFDRLIVAHARAAGLAQLVSADGLVQANYVRAVW